MGHWWQKIAWNYHTQTTKQRLNLVLIFYHARSFCRIFPLVLTLSTSAAQDQAHPKALSGVFHHMQGDLEIPGKIQHNLLLASSYQVFSDIQFIFSHCYVGQKNNSKLNVRSHAQSHAFTWLSDCILGYVQLMSRISGLKNTREVDSVTVDIQASQIVVNIQFGTSCPTTNTMQQCKTSC